MNYTQGQQNNQLMSRLFGQNSGNAGTAINPYFTPVGGTTVPMQPGGGS
jgi:hypothetical protein